MYLLVECLTLSKAKHTHTGGSQERRQERIFFFNNKIKETPLQNTKYLNTFRMHSVGSWRYRANN